MSKRVYPEYDSAKVEREARGVLSFLKYERQMQIPNMDELVDAYVAHDKQMYDVYSGLTKYENDIYDSNQRLMRAIKNLKGKTYYKHFQNLLQSLDHIRGKITFSDKPKGHPQEETECGRAIREIWVDQWSTGMEGDSFAGTVSVQIKPNKYLIIPYEC